MSDKLTYMKKLLETEGKSEIQIFADQAEHQMMVEDRFNKMNSQDPHVKNYDEGDMLLDYFDL